MLLIDLDPQANLTMSLGWIKPDGQAFFMEKTLNAANAEEIAGICARNLRRRVWTKHSGRR